MFEALSPRTRLRPPGYLCMAGSQRIEVTATQNVGGLLLRAAQGKGSGEAVRAEEGNAEKRLGTGSPLGVWMERAGALVWLCFGQNPLGQGS